LGVVVVAGVRLLLRLISRRRRVWPKLDFFHASTKKVSNLRLGGLMGRLVVGRFRELEGQYVVELLRIIGEARCTRGFRRVFVSLWGKTLEICGECLSCVEDLVTDFDHNLIKL
jgi:hypothetical protein